MKKILYIGRFNRDVIEGSDGVVIKNRVIYDRLIELIAIDRFDTDYIIRNKNIKHVIKFLYTLAKQAFLGRGIIIGSGGSDSSCKLINIIRRLTFNKPMWVVGLGGNMHDYLCSSPKNVAILKNTQAILAEGKKMVEHMRKVGLTQTYYVPNCKTIQYIPTKSSVDDIIKFVFFARVNRDKGCNDIFDAVRILNSKGLSGKFNVSFYGYKAVGYEDEFDKHVNQINNLAYRGARDARKKETFDELAGYDAMLFPTYWNDEGFPATVVDAFIAGLPIIISDWKCNGELIEDGLNGFLVPIKSPEAIAEKMEWFINNRDKIPEMAAYMQNQASKYDTRYVLSDSLLKEIGII